MGEDQDLETRTGAGAAQQQALTNNEIDSMGRTTRCRKRKAELSRGCLVI